MCAAFAAKSGSVGRTCEWRTSIGGDQRRGGGGYQPQQSVLKRHSGQRQTACIRNISAPHRSQSILSGSVETTAGRGALRMGTTTVLGMSLMRRDYIRAGGGDGRRLIVELA